MKRGTTRKRARGTRKARKLSCPGCEAKLEPPVRGEVADGRLIGHYECRCGWVGKKMLGPA